MSEVTSGTSPKLHELPADGGILSPSPLTIGHPDAPFNTLIGARWSEGT